MYEDKDEYWESQEEKLLQDRRQRGNLKRTTEGPTVNVRQGSKLSHAVVNSIKRARAIADRPRNRGLTKDTRSTVDLVLDPRTMGILKGLTKQNVFNQLSGCISTGKEVSGRMRKYISCLISLVYSLLGERLFRNLTYPRRRGLQCC